MRLDVDVQVPKPLLAALEPLGATCQLLGPGGTEYLPAEGGAYALILYLDRDCRVRRAQTAETLAAGWYVYAGSAYGPGGLRARLARHLRRDKALRWHVDQLSAQANYSAGLALAGGNECAIVGSLLETARFDTPSPGFGSSDCRACASHLLKFRGDA
ncbi:MAG: DUF123 domain-containing protein [Rhizobiales bacterium]|nr:DUF123 domain-containing protein [Hyphomicrobiales bacterium]